MMTKITTVRLGIEASGTDFNQEDLPDHGRNPEEKMDKKINLPK